jgi:Holliday junction resolvase RusA-like endonuclease
MMMPLSFSVPGSPIPQPRPRVSTRGGFARAYVPAKHPVHRYRASVAEAAKAAGAAVSEDAVAVELTFLFERPASHKTKKGLKRDAPTLPREDVDNLAKAVLDALTCVAWHDDRQVARLTVVKAYAQESATLVQIT